MRCGQDTCTCDHDDHDDSADVLTTAIDDCGCDHGHEEPGQDDRC